MRFLLFLACSVAALGQVVNGRIELQIIDSTGASVPGAKVTLKDSRRQIAMGAEATTSGDGAFVYASLCPSIYEIQVEATGFRKAVLGNIELFSGQPSARQ
ncbi:MAG: carboxypeptidase regulatory-like domain-containing protein [Acidobacteria bacterium]|nr:carboxypeptidase regulatory-like domain-containing protein [Acidobacteriota bacterium]